MTRSPSDEVLSQDVALFEPASKRLSTGYIAYPSRKVPRFIAHKDDRSALLFFGRIVSADRGVRGVVFRRILNLPFVPRILGYLAAESVELHVGSESRASVIEKIGALVRQHEVTLTRRIGRDLRVAKFCQRIAGPETKLLFLVSDEFGPLCIVKRMRSPQYNHALARECEAMRTLTDAAIESIPKLFFEDLLDDHLICAEEVISGVSLSRNLASKYEREIIDIVRRFPIRGSMASDAIAQIFEDQAPSQNETYAELLTKLRDTKTVIKLGVTHSDLGRVNILRGDRLVIIDWGRTCERPFWLIDAVYLIIRLRRILNLGDWQLRGGPVLCAYTGISSEIATALYCVHILSDILYKKHHDKYLAMSAAMPSVL